MFMGSIIALSTSLYMVSLNFSTTLAALCLRALWAPSSPSNQTPQNHINPSMFMILEPSGSSFKGSSLRPSAFEMPVRFSLGATNSRKPPPFVPCALGVAPDNHALQLPVFHDFFSASSIISVACSDVAHTQHQQACANATKI